MTCLAILSQTKEAKRHITSAIALLEPFFGLSGQQPVFSFINGIVGLDLC